jgi:hypothetical protein
VIGGSADRFLDVAAAGRNVSGRAVQLHVTQEVVLLTGIGMSFKKIKCLTFFPLFYRRKPS